MSGDDQDNQIPKTLKATNWSRIHEIAKNNEFLRKPAQGRPNLDEDDNPTAQIPQNEARKGILRQTSTNNLRDAGRNVKGEVRRKSTTFTGVIPRRNSGLYSLEEDSQEKSKTMDNKSGLKPFWGIRILSTMNYSAFEAESVANSQGSASRRSGGGDITSLGQIIPCCRPSKWLLHMMNRIVINKYWRIFVTILDAILLFGSSIRDLFCPKKIDLAFDIIFLLTIAVLLVDVIIQSHLVPNYFIFKIKKRRRNAEEKKSVIGKSGRQITMNGQSGHGSTTGRMRGVASDFVDAEEGSISIKGSREFSFDGIKFGGFLFWLDIISAFTLLFDVSLINPLLRNTRTYDISLDSSGIPKHGNHLFEMNNFIDFRCFNTYERWYFLIVVLRTPRIARVMQSSGIISLVLWILQSIQNFLTARKIKKMNRDSAESTIGDNKQSKKGKNETEGQQQGLLSSTNSEKSNLRGSNHITSKRKLDKMSQFIQNRSSIVERNVPQNAKNAQSARGISKDAFDIITTKSTMSRSRRRKKRRRESTQVGKEMHELTVRLVVVGCMIAIALSSLLSNHDRGLYVPSYLLVAHNMLTSLSSLNNSNISLQDTVDKLELGNSKVLSYTFGNQAYFIDQNNSLRDREMINVIIGCDDGFSDNENVECQITEATVNIRFFICEGAKYNLLLVFFIMITWYIAVSSFAGPITHLIVIPIERMIKILRMLVSDPLGYQSSEKYKEFVDESEELGTNSKWNKEILEGMETSFLMSTILRIGSLMKVGFGEAGAKIIRQSLNKSNESEDANTNVSCIFLFCDIRHFTDATECLREEVFVFTNKIAEVVHSLCHSYGGSANKNIGDAFLVSWLLNENTMEKKKGKRMRKLSMNSTVPGLQATNHQADKALLAVVKIIIALNYESFFVDELSAETSKRLQEKFPRSSGPLVQMGFGLHAGRAVQGAIGSHRKLDATYISNAVEQAEYLESSTKRYGVKLLMSGEFYRLLTPGNRRRCRQIDQVFFRDDDGDEYEEPPDPFNFERMELYTYDIDVNFVVHPPNSGYSKRETPGNSTTWQEASERSKNSVERTSMKTDLQAMTIAMGLSASMRPIKSSHVVGQSGADNSAAKDRDTKGRRWSTSIWNNINSSKYRSSIERVVSSQVSHESHSGNENDYDDSIEHLEGILLLPTEKCKYSPSIWLSEDMRIVRGRFADGQFFQQFNIGLQHYFNGEWDEARNCLESVDEKIIDGPARYFLEKMQKSNFVPPRGFTGWSEA